MPWPSNPYVLALYASALVALVIALLAWRRRSAPGATPLALMLGTTVIWAGAYGLALDATAPPVKTFWFNVMVIGALWGTPAFFAFAVQYTGRDHWLTRRNIILLCLVPALGLLLEWTNDWHLLFYAARDFTHPLPNGSWRVTPGLGFWLYLAYSYPVVLFTIGLILQAFRRAPRLYRGQTGAILFGTLIPLTGNMIYNLVVGSGVGTIDPTPLLFTVMGTIYAYGLFWFRLFDIVPVARHTLVEHMTDGVLVVDAQNRLIDVNPAALGLLGLTGQAPVGRHVDNLFTTWPESLARYRDATNLQTELKVGVDPAYHFDLRIEPLFDRRGQASGRLIVFRDITQRKQAEAALHHANERLQTQLMEIELLHAQLQAQAIRDPLTDLFNRRYLEETLERELARAARDNAPLSVVMMDVDHFKHLNDRYGHKAGDCFLQALAELLRTHSRAEDVACRYGGEEFVVVLPDAPLMVAARRANEWREALAALQVELEGQFLATTLSLGVACFPAHGRGSDELLRHADLALYQAKHAGRNQVMVSA